MDLINELIECLNSIDYSIFDEDCINELLDSRDSGSFDTEWCRVDREISALKNQQSYSDEIKKAQDEIRKNVFLMIKRNTESELSDYISDDFGLIYDSLVLNYQDKWLNKLIEQYKNKRIPTGEL